MAINPIERQSQPVILPNAIPRMPAVARILARHDRGRLKAFITVAIDLLDVLDGDSDLEGECSEYEVSRCTDTGQPVQGNGAGCSIADAGENAWIEWSKMRGSQKCGPNIAEVHEDAEEDDAAGQYDEDYHSGPPTPVRGAGCPISDPGEYEGSY
jgi:hypothetical protein